jgi:Fic family protein
MALKTEKMAVLEALKSQRVPVSLRELESLTDGAIAERTLRRWLADWVSQGTVRRTGRKRSTRYQWVQGTVSFAFMEGLSESQRQALSAQLRDLWTHTSTALEGNTLTLGDTHFVLEEGLTIFGKPLKDHEEVTGHARAIDLLYQSLNEPVTKALLYELHKAVQTEIETDIYKPNGAWKVEPNGTYVVGDDEEQLYLEYAAPREVEPLMRDLIEAIDSGLPVPLDQAARAYARIHMGVVHIHPFWDGNGRIARLVANVPLLKSGLPPLVIPTSERRNYLAILARYQLAIGQLSRQTGVWPDESRLAEFVQFCSRCYLETENLLARIRG